MNKRVKAKRGSWLLRNASSQAIKNTFRRPSYKRRSISDEWSVMEDSDAFKTFIEAAGKRATTNAINENKALGIPVTFLKDGWVVRRMPDGHIEKIKQVQEATRPIGERKLRKGMILHVKKTTH